MYAADDMYKLPRHFYNWSTLKMFNLYFPYPLIIKGKWPFDINLQITLSTIVATSYMNVSPHFWFVPATAIGFWNKEGLYF